MFLFIDAHPLLTLVAILWILIIWVLAKYVWQIRPENLRSSDHKNLTDVMGVIIDVETREPKGLLKEKTYSPIVEFRTDDGHWFISSSRVFSIEEPEIGQEILIKYNPDDPTKSMIVVNTNWHQRIFVILLILFIMAVLLLIWAITT